MPKHDDIKDVYLNRGWSWINKRDYDKAIEDFSSAISIDHKFDASYYGRAYVWNKKGDQQRAIVDAKEAVKLSPENEKYNDLLYKIQSSMTKE
jgi:tetratricopeptide (TPR) repeat protein